MSMDILVTALLDLAHELPALPKPLLVGGGFGLYLKQRHLEETEGLDTLIAGERWPPARATEDVDLLLPTEVIISVAHMQAIRTALDTLGYRPDVPTSSSRRTQTMDQSRLTCSPVTSRMSTPTRSK